MSNPHKTLDLPRSLGEGLVLRLATPADTEAVAEFNTQIHQEDGEPPGFLGDWTRLLMSEHHPTTSAQDFVVVEDTNTQKIVSVTCLIPQEWLYDGIPLKVGRPELVGTDPAYRRRGLIRAIFAAIHQLSDAYGHHLQGITGIPWYYRQFGYEYALDLGGGRDLPVANVPELKDDESEPYQVRYATEADIAAIIRLHQQYAADKLITDPADPDRWRYEITRRDFAVHINCLVDKDDNVLGAFLSSAEVWGSEIQIWGLVVDEDVSIRSVLPTVARALKSTGETYVADRKDKEGQPRTLKHIRFNLGAGHPAYEAFDAKLNALRKPYSWYIRVPDVAGFMRHVAPVLEKRLAGSVMSGYSGELGLTFYRSGLRLVFEQGRLTTAEDWQEPDEKKENTEAGAGLPPLVFLKLLFGYRSLEELRHAYPDCWANEEPTLLLNALFPKKASWLMALA